MRWTTLSSECRLQYISQFDSHPLAARRVIWHVRMRKELRQPLRVLLSCSDVVACAGDA